MPVIECPNGKWRVGRGKCIYDTKEKATEVYQAIISAGFLAVDTNKVSIDFDDTLNTSKGEALYKRLKTEKKNIYIVTRRQESASKEVYNLAESLGIPKNKIIFTNGAMKWETIKRLNIATHYDNNQKEIDLINKNTDARGVKF